MDAVVVCFSMYFIMCNLCKGFLLDDNEHGRNATSPDSLSKRLGAMETEVRQTVLSMNDIDMRVQRDFKNMSDEFAMQKALQGDTLRKYINLEGEYSDIQEMYSVLLQNNSDLGIQLSKFATLVSNLEKQISNLSTQFSSFSNLGTKFSTRSNLEIQVSNLTTQLSNLSNLGSQLSNLVIQVSNLQQKYTELKTAMDVSKKMVAFTVKLSRSSSSSSIIIPDKILTNIGGGYNSTSGIFTCPVKGLYSFSLHLISNSANNGIWIYKNNQQTTLAWSHRGEKDVGSASYVTYLDVGDTITLISSLSNLSLDPNSNFSGIKVQ